MKPISLEHNLRLLEIIEKNPCTTQANLAAHLGIAVGTVNRYLQRMIVGGYIQVQRMERKRLRYTLTPRGLTERSRLALRYVRASLRTYRQTRRHVMGLLFQVRAAGYDRIVLQGKGDLVEICRLSCLDQELQLTEFTGTGSLPLPVLKAVGTHIDLWLPARGNSSGTWARCRWRVLK